MSKALPSDPVGLEFGKWKVIGGFAKDDRTGQAYAWCQCLCGTQRFVRWGILTSGGSKSCGCDRARKLGAARRTHGQSNSPLHRVWRDMRQRCSNPNRKEWKNYGGRGITVCSEWDDFAVFRDWALANGYEQGLDIDRRDNEGPYSPENCVWVTRSENLRHTRRTRTITAWGETKALVAWAEDPRCIVSGKTLWTRLKLDWKPEDAMTLPLHTRKR